MNGDKGYVNAVTAAGWRWREQSDPALAERIARHRKSTIQASIMAVVGAVFLFALNWRTMGSIALGLAAVNVMGGWLVPPVFRVMDRSIVLLGRGIGIAITWVLLVPFFYLCFLPGRVFLAMTGKDLMCRRFPAPDKSFWIPYKERSATHAETQF